MSKKNKNIAKIEEVETGSVVLACFKAGGIIIGTLFEQGVRMINPDEHDSGAYYRIILGNNWIDVFQDELDSIRDVEELEAYGRR